MEGPKRQFHITKNRTYVITVSLRSRTFARAARSTSTRGFEYYYLAAESKLPMIYRFLSAANEHFPSGFFAPILQLCEIVVPRRAWYYSNGESTNLIYKCSRVQGRRNTQFSRTSMSCRLSVKNPRFFPSKNIPGPRERSPRSRVGEKVATDSSHFR